MAYEANKKPKVLFQDDADSICDLLSTFNILDPESLQAIINQDLELSRFKFNPLIIDYQLMCAKLMWCILLNIMK